jgi:hypothetical protein
VTPSQADALNAFENPIEAHARKSAAGLIDSVLCDVKFGTTVSLAAGLADVDVIDEWSDARRELTWIPVGAMRWASEIWQGEFVRVLRERVEQSEAQP